MTDKQIARELRAALSRGLHCHLLKPGQPHGIRLYNAKTVKGSLRVRIIEGDHIRWYAPAAGQTVLIDSLSRDERAIVI